MIKCFSKTTHGETVPTPLYDIWAYLLDHNNLTLYFNHFNSTHICFFRVFTSTEIVICNCVFLDIADVVDVLFADKTFGLETDGQCSMQFGKIMDNGNIHPCFL